MPGTPRRFEWEDALPGLRSGEFEIQVDEASIRAYKVATGDGSPASEIAPPGYVFTAAPQRRHATMASIGCRAPEQDPGEPRSTPYVGSDVRFHRPIKVGDTVRSVTVLDRTFERGGNRFMVFRVDASDAHGTPIAEYDYTVLWERGSQRAGNAPKRTAPSTPDIRGDSRIGTGTVLVKAETVQTIAAYGSLPVGRPDDWLSTHTNEDFARTAIFGATVNAGVATVGYTAQWLDIVERHGVLWNGGRLESRALAPVKAGDDLQIYGELRPAQDDGAGRVYEILVVNQSGVTAFRSVATLPIA
jgi:acyl dehydratase